MIPRYFRVLSVSGFTLIELMITVAVVAILASIAYPSYQEQVRKTHRAQAKADLIEYAQLAERFHTVNNTYVGFTLPSAVSPREGGTVRYNLALSPASTQAAFTLLATANGAQAKDRCGNLGLNQAGIKTVSKGTVSDCW
ncbi:type IV pilin protein [Lysobacter sp. H21R4]|uniref:type IV pilin protein n=1 Tax=Lysobacter sp. H21R4 TaxID=2781021 RepID=UPI00272DFCD4|nr:type IV pilin protein [Lysobacter sp. H21R4]